MSNLNNDYSDDKIIEIYRNRLSVEIFFKNLKSNFRFDNLTTHNKEKQKINIINNIILFLFIIIFQKLLKIFTQKMWMI